MPKRTHLAHFNWGHLVAPLDDPRVADFVAGFDAVHGVAERSPGFVWRSTGDGVGEAAALGRPLAEEGAPAISSFSVWRDFAAFEHFVSRTLHGRFMARRADWFVPGRSGAVLWHVPEWHIPGISEALDSLDRLRSDGPGRDVHDRTSLTAAGG